MWLRNRRIRRQRENDRPVFTQVDETESQVLIEVTSKRGGTHRYWVYKKPLDVRFTPQGIRSND